MLRQANQRFAPNGLDVQVESFAVNRRISVPRESDSRFIRRKRSGNLISGQSRKRKGSQGHLFLGSLLLLPPFVNAQDCKGDDRASENDAYADLQPNRVPEPDRSGSTTIAGAFG